MTVALLLLVIVTYLFVIGNAGIVTTIGAFAGSVVSGNYLRTLNRLRRC